MRQGMRGLAGRSSLPKLLAQYRDVRNHMDLPDLGIEQILTWADAYHERAGRWPNVTSGEVEEAPGETWRNIQTSLHQGLRGLPGGYSLARLLKDHRQARNRLDLTPLSEDQILAWADSHHARTGHWPGKDSGRVADSPNESWGSINQALHYGTRGLPGKSSLAQLLAKARRKRNRKALPRLTEERILEWADSHLHRTGKWPDQKAGPVHDAPGENWRAISTALIQGVRGLPGGSSLVKLLVEHRGLKSRSGQPPLTIEQILSWANAHFARTGRWPTRNAGPVLDAADETWGRIDNALYEGLRGLSKGETLGQLLARRRNVRGRSRLTPRLTVEQILEWADAHYNRTGQWPKQDSGAIQNAVGETWKAIHMALLKGSRGLPGGSSLVRLLVERRGMKSKSGRPPLTTEQILSWADAHFARTGKWPKSSTRGSIPESPDETWQAV
jgi:hypothetical protein